MTSPTEHGHLASNAQVTSVTVLCLFRDRGRAEAALRGLKAAGFTNDQLGVVMQEPGNPTLEPESTGSSSLSGTTAAVDGSLVGGLIGLLASLLIPGSGPLLLGGALASTLAGAGLGAATGGLIGILAKLGASESEGEHFEQGLRAGGVLLTVNAAERTHEALELIESYRPDIGPRNRRSRNSPDYSGPERRLVGI